MISSQDLLTGLLRDVSRSFYLTLRVLPGGVRPQIGLAYLLARATDTIADTEVIPVLERLELLQKLRSKIDSADSSPLDLGQLASNQGSKGERALLERFNEAWALLFKYTPADQDRIRDVLRTITSGQELDLKRFQSADASHIIALEQFEDLDDYTYRVAGCVGEFWTKICRAHLFPDAGLNDKQLLEDGIRFGKGLQLVNILRDLPSDLRIGRCYIPSAKLSDAGLTPANLLQPGAQDRFRPIYDGYLDLAESHLQAGWRYTNTLPYRQMRVRLACAWPVLIGKETIERLRKANVLDNSVRVKITRKDVRDILLKSIITYPWPRAWLNLYDSKPFPAAPNLLKKDK